MIISKLKNFKQEKYYVHQRFIDLRNQFEIQLYQQKIYKQNTHYFSRDIIAEQFTTDNDYRH